MKMVVNRKEWRDRTVMTLIQAKSIDAHTAIAQAEVLEAYVFRDDFIVEIADPDQRAALKKIVDIFVTTIPPTENNGRLGLLKRHLQGEKGAGVFYDSQVAKEAEDARSAARLVRRDFLKILTL